MFLPSGFFLSSINYLVRDIIDDRVIYKANHRSYDLSKPHKIGQNLFVGEGGLLGPMISDVRDYYINNLRFPTL